jgi:3-oxoacyl-[acyl-carrier protein] reductase
MTTVADQTIRQAEERQFLRDLSARQGTDMDLGISGKRALVWGASRGIGFAAAQRLASEGAQVILVARSAKALEASADALRQKNGDRIDFHPADVTSEQDRAAVFAKWPAVDILLTNPGIPQKFAAFSDLEREDWQWWWNAYFYSAVEIIQAYVSGMVERGFGRIINLSVNTIKAPTGQSAHYHAARLALSGATATLVREVASKNVTINSVLPGFVDTDALRTALGNIGRERGMSYEAVLAAALRRCPAGRMAAPGEVGDLIAMLASAQMGFVTGQNIIIDGGEYQGLF